MTFGGKTYVREEQFYTRRTDVKGIDSVLGCVGKGYNILQNSECFEFFDSIVKSKLAMFETAGVLGKGERIFITAKLPKQYTIKVATGDFIEPYIFLTNSHDGAGCVTAAFTTTRIVCNNTLNMALDNCRNKVTLRHTKNMKANLKAAAQIMQINTDFNETLTALLPEMAKTKISDRQFDEIVIAAFADKATAKEFFLLNRNAGQKNESEIVSTQLINTMAEIREYNASNSTQLMESTKGTVWGALNAVTGYFQNVEQVAKTESDKLTSILDGRIANKTQLAWDAATHFMKNLN